MVKRNYLYKMLIVATVSIFIFSLCNTVYGFEFNDDIQKIALNYDYFDGIGNDKILRSKSTGSWHLLKSDGSMIGLKGNYLDYAGIETGEYYKLDDNYYRFVVAIDDKLTRFGFVDKNGVECFVEGYSFADPTISDKYWVLMNVDNDTNYKFGLYDRYNNKVVIPVVYDSLLYLNDDRIIVRNGDAEGIIDINQKIILPFEYNFLEYINDNFIIALGNGFKYGLINIKNENLLPFEYDVISKAAETNNYCRIIKDNKIGLINGDNFELLIPIEYDSLYYIDEMYIENKLIVAEKDGKTGIVDMDNEEVVPFIYDRIELTGNCFEVYIDGLAGLLDSKGNEILPAEAIDIMEVKNDFITAKVYVDFDHKYAVYDMKGNEIVPPIYDYINYHASEKYMIVNNDGIANLVDKDTKEAVLTNSNYSDIWYINDKYFAGGNNSYYSIVNFSGQELTPSYYYSVSVVSVDDEELLAATRQTSKAFDRRIDYFKQTKGPSSWAVGEVNKAIEGNLVPFEYQAAYTFNIKRHEFCTIIVEFLEEYYDTSREEIIKDNNIDIANSAIDELNKDVGICFYFGIVKGRGNGIFDGESEITREEAAVMLTNLAKYLGLNTDAEDVKLNDKKQVSEWAMNAVNFVLKNKFMQGVGNDMFSPKSNITREQTYIIMYRILNETEKANLSSQEQQLLLNGISLTKDIIRSVYRVYKGEEKYTYEVLLFSLAVNDDESNLYKGYFPFDEDKGAFIFPLDKSNEVLIQVFGEKEYSFENVFNYDEESDIYYKNLDFGWNTGFRTENATAEISDDKSKLYTQFELINQWYDVEGDPVATAIAECEITYSIIKNNDKTYLQFKDMEILSKLVD